MIDEEQVYKEFEKALLEALAVYKEHEYVSYEAISIFIEDRVWESTIKYNRMINVTKEKFFEALYNDTPLDEYVKGITDLWKIDHSYMDKSIEELGLMVIQKDFYNAEMYGNKKLTTRSIKLENYWREYTLKDDELFPLNPERDFRLLEQRYVQRHIKLYETIKKRYKDSKDLGKDLSSFLKKYESLDKTIPYFSHTTDEIIRYVDIGTYLNMLYNVNLTRSAWNRAIYDAKLLGNHLWYLPAHPYACPHCMEYQGYVYTDHPPNVRETNILQQFGLPGSWYKGEAIHGGVGHPNCKHVWTSYWSQEQIQDEKFNSAEWEERYKNKQKIQSLDLEKSRLLTNRRIYRELGQQDLVDKTTEQIKRIREKKKELEK
jgi:hypothetical protein